MQVDIWSDIVCPFCYIGKHQFEEALADFEHKDNVAVKYHSFELDPNAELYIEHDVYEMLVNKYGINREQAIESNQTLAEKAKQHGIELNVGKSQLTNSFDAHRLVHFAREHNKEQEMLERLHKAYFTDGLHIGEVETLIELANEVGLDKEEAKKVLISDTYTEEVRFDEDAATQLGITGVPFFVIDNKFGVSGAQGKDNLLNALNQAWAEA